jgi:hypothetical protein
VPNPKGPVFCEYPHLAHLDPVEFDELNDLLRARNSRYRRKRVNGIDPFLRVPRKRTRFPGQHALCWYCGRHYVWGGNGVADNLMCSGSREWHCWNSFGFDGRLTGNACVAYKGLVEKGKIKLAYPSVLARYGVAQVRTGRKVGCSLNVQDVMSEYCQRRKNVTVERLDVHDAEDDAWKEIVIEDKRSGPAEVATTRMDFSSWLRLLPRRLRTITTFLARNETTSAASRRFGLSHGRISQIRSELRRDWQRFQGDEPALPSASSAS